MVKGKKTGKKTGKKVGETRTEFSFPNLHEHVAAAVLSDNIHPWFHETGTDDEAEHTYATHVMGRFSCHNGCRGAAWGSKKVAIVIYGFEANGYHALVFNQRCRGCDGLGTFAMDSEAYIERVAYRLRKWAGIRTEKQVWSPKKGPPHETRLCEGCKRGVCQERDL